MGFDFLLMVGITATCLKIGFNPFITRCLMFFGAFLVALR